MCMSAEEMMDNFNRIIKCINTANYFLNAIAGEISRHCPVANNYGYYERLYDEENFTFKSCTVDIVGIYTSWKAYGYDVISSGYLHFPKKYLKMEDNDIILDWYHTELDKISKIISDQKAYHEKEIKKLHAGEILIDSYKRKSITIDTI